MSRPDVLIIGAGIVGAACARELAQRGLYVSVLDPNPAGLGTTAAGMGHLVVLDDSPAELHLTAWSVRRWRELLSGAPREVAYRGNGTLWIAVDSDEMAVVARKRDLLRDVGVAAESVDAQELEALEPNLTRGLAGALLVPGDGVLYPPTTTRWLLEWPGITLERERVVRVAEGCVHLESGAKRHAGHVVVAAGLASLPLVDVRLPPDAIRARKGHLIITERNPGFVVNHQLVELGYLASAHGSESASVAFNVQPRPTGQVLIGSSRQFDVGPDVEPHVIARMLERAFRFVPRLAAQAALRAWTGSRPATRDGLPFVGPLPGDARTLLAAGHEGLGITTATATAHLIAAALMGFTAELDPLAYRVERMMGGAA